MSGNIEGKNTVVFGAQWGDEGKGRVAHLLAGEGFGIVARFNGGANAGHTFYADGIQYNTHQIPSGITHDGVVNLLTNSSLVDPVRLIQEMDELTAKGVEISPTNLAISRYAKMVLPHHVLLDAIREVGPDAQGSTLRGIGPMSGQKYHRDPITFIDYSDNEDNFRGWFMGQYEPALIELEEKLEYVEDPELRNKVAALIVGPGESWSQWQSDVESMRPFTADTFTIVHDALDSGVNILAEGAQSFGLDIDQGYWPQVSSSHVGVGGVLGSLGVGPETIGDVYAVAKLTLSRVGGDTNSVPTIIEDDELAASLRGEKGSVSYEAGKSTGRERDMAWLDIPQLRRSITANKAKNMKLILTKLDMVNYPNRDGISDKTRIATHYELDGHNVDIAPSSVSELKRAKPQYEDFETWEEDITGVRSFGDLPNKAQLYVNRISELVGLEVALIGVGYDAEQIIDRRQKTSR